MSIAIYLSPNAANTSTVIYIHVNRHNPQGWIEKSNGRVIKLVNKDQCEALKTKSNSL